MFKLSQNILHTVGDLNGITAGELINRDPHRRCSVEIHGINAIGFATQLDTTDIFQANQTSGVSRPQDNVFEFLCCRETTLELDRKCEFLAFRGRSTTNFASGHQTVLALELINNIRCREIVGG